MIGGLTLDAATIAMLIYLGGVIVGLARIDAGPGARMVLALLWPIGPLAFVVTIAILIIASFIAFPRVGAAAAALALLVLWLLR
jgi:hypothetical protein